MTNVTEEAVTDHLEAIREIWRQTLGVDNVADEDNFFLLGGDSMLGSMMLAAVTEHLQRDVALGDLYNNPTLLAFSKCISSL